MNNKQFAEAWERYEAGDYSHAFCLFLSLAELGDPSSMSQVAVMLGDGVGVERDVDQSIEWDLRAIDAGSLTSLMNLGVTHRKLGNCREARYWFERAVESGDKDAALDLAKLLYVSDFEIGKVKELLAIVMTAENITAQSKDEAIERDSSVRVSSASMAIM